MSPFFCQKDLPAMFETLFCTQAVVLCSLISTTMQTRQYSHKWRIYCIKDTVYTLTTGTHPVFNVLNSNTTNVIGTFRQDGKGLPDAFVKKKFKQGETAFQYEHKMGLAITYWKDKDVFMITTCTPDSKTVVKRCGFYTHTSKTLLAALTEVTK